MTKQSITGYVSIASHAEGIPSGKDACGASGATRNDRKADRSCAEGASLREVAESARKDAL